MKKTGVTLMAILFVFALFVGQGFAAEQKGQTDSQMQGQQMRGTTGMQGQTQEINRASEITGKNVQNQQGQDLGQVDDLVFDNDGNISYLVLSRGGVMGVGGNLVPIPWKEDKIQIQEDNVILNMDQEKLDQAPSFSSGEWDNMSQQEFQQRVHGYYEKDYPTKERMTPGTQRQEGTTTPAPGTERQEGVTTPDTQGQQR
jgi:sporulation protein YlmC with PRC-barrel domain